MDTFLTSCNSLLSFKRKKQDKQEERRRGSCKRVKKIIEIYFFKTLCSGTSSIQRKHAYYVFSSHYLLSILSRITSFEATQWHEGIYPYYHCTLESWAFCWTPNITLKIGVWQPILFSRNAHWRIGVIM